MEPEPPGAASFCLEPESAPGPWPSGAGAAQKSGGSATLHLRDLSSIFKGTILLVQQTFSLGERQRGWFFFI